MVRVDHLSGLDRKLGYRGEDRFVLFYYDESADGLVWKDTRGYGFGSWLLFDLNIDPARRLLNWQVDRVVLLIDRTLKQAFLAKLGSLPKWNSISIGKSSSNNNFELAVA